MTTTEEYHKARQFEQLEPAISLMGGWANFRHWILNHEANYFATCAKLQEELNQLERRFDSLGGDKINLIDEVARLKEVISYLPKVPTQPYEKELAQENDKLRVLFYEAFAIMNYFNDHPSGAKSEWHTRRKQWIIDAVKVARGQSD